MGFCQRYFKVSLALAIYSPVGMICSLGSRKPCHPWRVPGLNSIARKLRILKTSLCRNYLAPQRLITYARMYLFLNLTLSLSLIAMIAKVVGNACHSMYLFLQLSLSLSLIIQAVGNACHSKSLVTIAPMYLFLNYLCP